MKITKKNFLNLIKPYTMTSNERIFCLYDSLEYLVNNNISGDLVECGVWKGGNILGMCEYLKSIDKISNNIFLYDTFTGMTPPSNHDICYKGRTRYPMCVASLEEVSSVISLSNYPKNKIKYIVGDVNQTLNDKNNIPECISLLRLDTDWYESTMKELDILWPKLVVGGVLIVDDYGHWQGCKKAVDEFFKKINYLPTIEIIDYTGIRIIKK